MPAMSKVTHIYIKRLCPLCRSNQTPSSLDLLIGKEINQPSFTLLTGLTNESSGSPLLLVPGNDPVLISLSS